MCGNYEKLEGGNSADGMVDLSGGITRVILLKEKTPTDLFAKMQQAFQKCSLLGCGIQVAIYSDCFDFRLQNRKINSFYFVKTENVSFLASSESFLNNYMLSLNRGNHCKLQLKTFIFALE